MIRYLENLKLPENSEILLMLILGICLQMTDGSPFSLKYRWSVVWNIQLPAEYFNNIAQKILKTILAIIITVRCSTTYAYVVSAVLVIFCLLKKTTPKLMLLWLLISGIKSIFMTFAEAIAGVYVCSAFGKIRSPCIEFFISKALEIIFAAYLWGNVLSIYQDMENKAKNEGNLSTKDDLFSSFTRQRARSLLDESTLYKTACLNSFEFKDVPHIILQMLRRDDEMSEDSLLGPGMMLASVSNLGSFDNLKTSQSLGELGFMDLGSTQVVGLEEDEDLSYRDKVLRFLKLTRSDVANIKLNKSRVENDIFTVEDDIWARVIASGTHINKPKQTRTEVFIREIPQPEEAVIKTGNQRKGIVKFDMSFSNLLVGKHWEFQDDQEEEESCIFSQDEDEGKEDEETFRLFMSNIKEGIFIRRFGLGFGIRVMKENRYENLYKQDFMSRIGPEVFERATNLPKVTSFTKIMRNSVSLPEILPTSRKISISGEDSKGKIDRTSSLDLYSRDPEFFKKQIVFEDSISEEEIEDIIQKTSTADEFSIDVSLQLEHENTEIESIILEDKDIKANKNVSDSFELPNVKDKICFPLPSITDLNKVKELEPCFRKRRILIKRTGTRRNIQSQKLSCESCCSPGSSDQAVDSQIQFASGRRKLPENRQQSNNMLSKQDSSRSEIDNKPQSFQKNQMYFLTELLNKLHWKVSISYFDLNEKTSSQHNSRFWSQTILNSLEPRKEKMWKSDVLKIVETCFMPKYPKSFGPSSISKKNKKIEYLNLSHEKKSFLEEEEGRGGGREKETPIQLVEPEMSITSSVRSANSNVIQDNLKLDMANEHRKSFEENPEMSDSFASVNNIKEGLKEKANVSASEKPSEVFVTEKNSKSAIACDAGSQFSKAKIINNSTEGEIKTAAKEKKLNFVTLPKVSAKKNSLRSQESDEPISLYYSKAADLASPLLDMRRFIYPDHIHYSYKHVNKKGFDVDINGGFPLLVGENLPRSTPLIIVNESTSRNREPEIKRRPMDLSFATTNAFAHWQNSHSIDPETKQSQTTDISTTKIQSESFDADFIKNMKGKKMKYLKKMKEKKESRVLNGFTKAKSKSKPFGKNFNDVTFMYSAKDYVLIEKLIRMHMQFNKNNLFNCENSSNERIPVQISSTQLHSNKGCKNSIKNPAILLQKNKSRSERKKIETQEERTKDMFARLASEAFLQNSNMFTSSGSKRNI